MLYLILLRNLIEKTISFNFAYLFVYGILHFTYILYVITTSKKCNRSSTIKTV